MGALRSLDTPWPPLHRFSLKTSLTLRPASDDACGASRLTIPLHPLGDGGRDSPARLRRPPSVGPPALRGMGRVRKWHFPLTGGRKKGGRERKRHFPLTNVRLGSPARPFGTGEGLLVYEMWFWECLVQERGLWCTKMFIFMV